MNKTDKLNRAVDDGMDQVVAALENIKVHAISTANEIGRTTRKSIHRARWAKGEAWSDATSRAKVLRSRVQLLPARTAATHHRPGAGSGLFAQSGSPIFPHEP
ncbi:MAG: hypothetical protein JO170_02975 [Verrucomicrobia bacterium]|nr:hypothetical protein [Verrucomicrobiota bacterium]